MVQDAPIVVAVALAFGVAAGLIWLASLNPRRRQATRELWAIYRSEFLIAGAVLVPAALGVEVFLLALLVFVWRGQVEFFRLFDLLSEGRLPRAAMIGAAVLVVAGSFARIPFLLLVLLAGMVAIGIAGQREPGSVRQQRVRIAIASLIFPGLLAALVAGLRAGPNGFTWIFFVYATAEIGDAFALLFGKLFGRSHPLPKLSPRKTAEGLIAGLAFGGVAGFLIAHYVLQLSFMASLRCVALVLIAAMAGDLLTSALKRSRGKKDFSPVLRQHGGVLDIYDSFLLAAPVFFLLRPLLLA